MPSSITTAIVQTRKSKKIKEQGHEIKPYTMIVMEKDGRRRLGLDEEGGTGDVVVDGVGNGERDGVGDDVGDAVGDDHEIKRLMESVW